MSQGAEKKEDTQAALAETQYIFDFRMGKVGGERFVITPLDEPYPLAEKLRELPGVLLDLSFEKSNLFGENLMNAINLAFLKIEDMKSGVQKMFRKKLNKVVRFKI